MSIVLTRSKVGEVILPFHWGSLRQHFKECWMLKCYRTLQFLRNAVQGLHKCLSAPNRPLSKGHWAGWVAVWGFSTLVSFRKGSLWPDPDRQDRTVQHCPSSGCSWAICLGEQCRFSATGWDLFAWNRDSDRCEPGFCSHWSPSDLLSSPFPSQLGARSKLLQQQLSWGSSIEKILFFLSSCSSLSGLQLHSLCVSLLKDMLPAVSWVLLIWPLLKHKREIKTCFKVTKGQKGRCTQTAE